MNDQKKTKAQLIAELANLREQVGALTESESKYLSIFSHSTDAIMLIDPSEDKILDANPKASQMLGYSLKE